MVQKNKYFQSPRFIPATPGGELKKELQNKVNETGIRPTSLTQTICSEKGRETLPKLLCKSESGRKIFIRLIKKKVEHCMRCNTVADFLDHKSSYDLKSQSHKAEMAF